MATIKLNRALVLDIYGFHAVNETVDVADEHVAQLLAQHGSDVSLIQAPAPAKNAKGKGKDTPPPAESEEQPEHTDAQPPQADPAASDVNPPATDADGTPDAEQPQLGAATTGKADGISTYLPTNHKR